MMESLRCCAYCKHIKENKDARNFTCEKSGQIMFYHNEHNLLEKMLCKTECKEFEGTEKVPIKVTSTGSNVKVGGLRIRPITVGNTKTLKIKE